MAIKRIFPYLCLVIFCSCSSGWDNESKTLFYEACKEDAHARGLDENKTKTVCDCRLETVQKKYPTLAEAMDNIDAIMKDEDLKNCEQTIIPTNE